MFDPTDCVPRSFVPGSTLDTACATCDQPRTEDRPLDDAGDCEACVVARQARDAMSLSIGRPWPPVPRSEWARMGDTVTATDGPDAMRGVVIRVVPGHGGNGRPGLRVRWDSGAEGMHTPSTLRRVKPIDAARFIVAAAGFVADGATAEERVRLGTSRSPVYGGTGGERRTFGGRERYRLADSDIRLTLWARTVFLYRLLGGGKIASLASWPTKDFTAVALQTALGTRS